MKFILIALLVTTIATGTTFANSTDRQRRQTIQNCPDACLAVYDPVCASNGKCIRSFSNGCQMGICNCNAAPSQRYTVVPNHYCNNFQEAAYSQCVGYNYQILQCCTC